MESHPFCNRNHDEKFFLHICLEKVTLFCISIFIMKLINQKTQNNFCSSQIIVPDQPEKMIPKKTPSLPSIRLKSGKN